MMNDITRTEIYQKALAHTIQHANAHKDALEYVEYITEKKGNVYFCTGMLANYTYANAIVSWFRDHNLTAFKEWCYICAKLERMLFQHEPYRWFPAYMLFSPLLSDNIEIIDWYRQHRISYDYNFSDIKDRDNPKQPAFHGFKKR